MKFIACSDLHITDKVPVNRKDDYATNIINKFNEILEITRRETKMNVLLVAGDFFDSPTVPYKITRQILELILDLGTSIFVVPGQHDLRFHKGGLDNTPLGILQAAQAVNILSSKEPTFIKGISFIGSGWNEEPEKEADVIITHRMITETDPLFFDQEDFQTANQIFKKYKWAKCIISGDNHHPFISKTKKQILINCGSMVRSSKIQIKHKPKVWVINTSSWSAKPIELRIKPAKQVFDFSKIQMKEEKEAAKQKAEEDIDKFIGSLTDKEKKQPNFKNILKNVIKKTKPKNQVVRIINSIMEEIV